MPMFHLAKPSLGRRENSMMDRSSLTTLAVAAAALLAGGWLADRSDLPTPGEWIYLDRLEPQSAPSTLQDALAAMQELHRRTLAAKSLQARQDLLADRAKLMEQGLRLMRQMKQALPTTATGEPISDTITPAQSDQVNDFFALMESLIQLKEDQEDIAPNPSDRGFVHLLTHESAVRSGPISMLRT